MVDGTGNALLNLMALPYPPEVETGKLNPRSREPRKPFDVDEHITQAVEARADELALFGVTLPLPEGDDVMDTVAQFRTALVTHFNERRPDADSATWQIFVSQARAQLQQLQQADDQALGALLKSIDGL